MEYYRYWSDMSRTAISVCRFSHTLKVTGTPKADLPEAMTFVKFMEWEFSERERNNACSRGPRYDINTRFVILATGRGWFSDKAAYLVENEDESEVCRLVERTYEFCTKYNDSHRAYSILSNTF